MLDTIRVTRGALTLGFALALTPTVFAIGPLVESRAFPVTTRAEVLEETIGDEGVSFFVRFGKRRQCEFLGLAWYDGERRLPIEFEPGAGVTAPATRPMGGHFAGPWFLRGMRTLAGTRAWALHRCHPLWITFTEFYRG
ncbi:MAG: hypothetical protein AAF390_13140 [Pseudomonadota bacterium]